MNRAFAIACFAVAVVCHASAQSERLPRSSTAALTHVRVIDGTGTPEIDDQTIVIDNGRIRAVGPSATARVPAGADIRDLRGRTVMPGLVGMHEHLFYQLEPPGSGAYAVLAQTAFAKLYLAAGVTTIRTAGTVDFDGDARLKKRIDEGVVPGPKVHLTSPYLQGTTPQPDPEGIARIVERYADSGATSFKAHTLLRAAELKAVITAAHNRGLHVTGHLCAAGFREAAALGIDNIEHGLPFDTDLYSGKEPDQCPNQSAVFMEINRLDVGDSAIREVIGDLVRHGVAVTSTLAVLESYTGDQSFDPRVRPMLAPRLRDTYDAAAGAGKDRNAPVNRMFAATLRTEMAFERAFVAAGGKLLAGVDPTGWGGVLAGFGDQREVELLVEAGFRPEQAIEIATSNGARFLAEREIGTIAPGMQADLFVVAGDPARTIADVRKVEMVFKDGRAYDPAVLLAEAEGTVGAFELQQFMTWKWFGIAGVLSALIANRVIRRRHARS